MELLSEKTLIPVGLAVVAIGGGSMWLTSLHFETVAVAKEVQVISRKQDVLDGIQTDLAVIKTKLEKIERKMGDK